jgi:hypothetical protein
MRFLLTTHGYDRVGGTETYVLTVAEHIQRLGHQVRIYATRCGAMADLTRSRGVEVLDSLDDLVHGGVRDDVVLAQDAGTSYDLAALWPEVPQVYVSHSTMYDIQQPPLVPGPVVAVVALSDRFGRRAEALNAELRVVRMRQPIDSEWLVPDSEPAARPRRALLLGNYLDGHARRLLTETWSDLGVEVVQVGYAGARPGTATLTPRDDIAAADIVVGKGRSVLDAMSCGRPAYVYDVHGADGWVTADSYDAIEADGFAGQALPEVADAARLRRDLDAYDPTMGQVNRQLILKHHGARTHADDLVRLCRELAPDASRGIDEAAELARQLRMRWRAETEVLNLQRSLRAARTRAQQAERDLEGARARRRRLEAHHERLLRSRWVRLGRAVRVVRPR